MQYKKQEKEVAHGQMVHPSNKNYSNARRCYEHGWHGPLYLCNTYSRYIKNKIRKLTYKFRYGK